MRSSVLSRAANKTKKGSYAGVILVVVALTVYAAIVRSSAEDVSLHVTKSAIKGDNGGQTFRIWGKIPGEDVEAFEVTDSWIFLSWDASDRYGKLEEGTTHTVKVAGWRIPFLSRYRNIVEVK